MDILDMYDILEKYNLKEAADEEYARRTVNHTGATDDSIRYEIYAEFVSSKWREIRAELHNIRTNSTCNLPPEKISELEESMAELKKAISGFKNAAFNFPWKQ